MGIMESPTRVSKTSSKTTPIKDMKSCVKGETLNLLPMPAGTVVGGRHIQWSSCTEQRVVAIRNDVYLIGLNKIHKEIYDRIRKESLSVRQDTTNFSIAEVAFLVTTKDKSLQPLTTKKSLLLSFPVQVDGLEYYDYQNVKQNIALKTIAMDDLKQSMLLCKTDRLQSIGQSDELKLDCAQREIEKIAKQCKNMSQQIDKQIHKEYCKFLQTFHCSGMDAMAFRVMGESTENKSPPVSKVNYTQGNQRQPAEHSEKFLYYYLLKGGGLEKIIQSFSKKIEDVATIQFIHRIHIFMHSTREMCSTCLPISYGIDSQLKKKLNQLFEENSYPRNENLDVLIDISADFQRQKPGRKSKTAVKNQASSPTDQRRENNIEHLNDVSISDLIADNIKFNRVANRNIVRKKKVREIITEDYTEKQKRLLNEDNQKQHSEILNTTSRVKARVHEYTVFASGGDDKMGLDKRNDRLKAIKEAQEDSRRYWENTERKAAIGIQRIVRDYLVRKHSKFTKAVTEQKVYSNNANLMLRKNQFCNVEAPKQVFAVEGEAADILKKVLRNVTLKPFRDTIFTAYNLKEEDLKSEFQNERLLPDFIAAVKVRRTTSQTSIKDDECEIIDICCELVAKKIVDAICEKVYKHPAIDSAYCFGEYYKLNSIQRCECVCYDLIAAIKAQIFVQSTDIVNSRKFATPSRSETENTTEAPFLDIDVSGDGACLFHAIALGLQLNENAELSSRDLRNVAASHLEHNREPHTESIKAQIITLFYQNHELPDNDPRKNQFPGIPDTFKTKLINAVQEGLEAEQNYANSEEGVNDYINHMFNPTAWGGEIELGVLADLLHLQFLIYDGKEAIEPRHPFIGSPEAPKVHLLFDGDHYGLRIPKASFDFEDIPKTASSEVVPSEESSHEFSGNDYIRFSMEAYTSDAFVNSICGRLSDVTQNYNQLFVKLQEWEVFMLLRVKRIKNRMIALIALDNAVKDCMIQAVAEVLADEMKEYINLEFESLYTEENLPSEKEIIAAIKNNIEQDKRDISIILQEHDPYNSPPCSENEWFYNIFECIRNSRKNQGAVQNEEVLNSASDDVKPLDPNFESASDSVESLNFNHFQIESIDDLPDISQLHC